MRCSHLNRALGKKMEIITNTKESNHAQEIIELLSWAERCYLCTSFVDKQGIELLLPTLQAKAENEQFYVTLFSNAESKYTKPWVIKKLNKLPYITHNVVKPDGRRLHSKIYLFVRKDEFVVIIGSANLTANGLMNNEEMSMKQKGTIPSMEFSEIENYFTALER